MNRLQEIERMYANMSPAGRDYLLGMARQLLRSFPGEGGVRLLPAAEQADQVELLDNEPNGAVYQFPLVGVRKPVHRKKADLA